MIIHDFLSDDQSEGISLNSFLSDNHYIQRKHHKISQYPFTLNERFQFKNSTTRYVIELLVTRFMVMQLRVLDYPGICREILSRLRHSGVKHITLQFNYKNRQLADYIAEYLRGNLVSVEVVFHKKKCMYFTVTSEHRLSNIFYKCKFFVASAVIIALLIMGKVLDFFHASEKIDGRFNLWMSFGNNREKLDYDFIPEYNSKNNLKFLHPNPYKLFLNGVGKQDFDHSLYRFGKYNISIVCFIKKIIELNMHFEEVLSEYLTDIQKHFDINLIYKYSQSYVYILKLHALHTLLVSLLLKNIGLRKDSKTILVYRGGNANGIYYSALNHKNFINVLLPHGTEFFPLDHAIYHILDYNILPSDVIVRQWIKHDPVIESEKCHHLGLGRPYYDYLGKTLTTKQWHPQSKLVVGIVLTYDSLENVLVFIDDIVESFGHYGSNVTFSIKQRPNLIYDLEKYKSNINISIFCGDIFEFLQEIDLVVVGISNMGVIGMVGLDAVYSDIATIYYMPGKAKKELGYSWDESMADITFFSKNTLTSYVASNANIVILLMNLKRDSLELKHKIGPSDGATKKIGLFLEGL